ncbi:NAD(P)/FAD-dependent oxidoreductase [Psychrobacter sp. FDAARGOS_221]|uniref:NAD(P)/FAD-dependent oxidoreductase n=1 Tax=Psychrobacter sp. FDAARGOS_221 TaxID=1975705 RepID=UPI000BB52E12|nr:NAD(P)-binding protein [Psychrobacter sp. FDAARGOS_221]PNK60131.1 NADP transhydrogenase subunit alpha [Psychrobacter sp. FDAARGOS_221]
MITTTPKQPLKAKQENSLQVAIIGGGLTGLITASLLEQYSLKNNCSIELTIFEKSAGVGRLATRYKQANEQQQMWQFDFGAQFFTAKTEAFRHYLQPWLEAEVVQPWLARTASIALNKGEISQSQGVANAIEVTGQWSAEQPRYISCAKMTSLGRKIAKTLQFTDIYYKTKVAALTESALSSIDSEHGDCATTLFDEQGNVLGVFDWVICTAPQAQAIELVAQTKFEYTQAIKSPNMLACYTLMLGWNDQSSLPDSLQSGNWDVLQVENSGANGEDSILDRVFIEHHKPGRESLLPSVTIHASNIWAQAHVDDELDTVQDKMLAATKQILGWDQVSAPVHIDCHRWRYASTQLAASQALQESVESCAPTQQRAYVDHKRQWIVTGDWCDEGGRIESCFNAASDVVEIISNDAN